MAERYRIRDDPKTGWTLEWGSGRAGGLTGTEWISIQTNMSQAGAGAAVKTIRDRGGSVDFPQELTVPETGFREVAPAPSEPPRTPVGVDPTFRSRQLGSEEPPVSTGIGEVPPLNPDDFYWKWDVASSDMIPAKKGESGAVFSNVWWSEANEARANVAGGFPGTAGPSGPTAAELAIERSKVDAQNLATFISGTIAELETEIDSKRLSTEQALGEFNKRLDAFAEAGSQFQGIQPYTITPGSKYLPGREPGGVGERLGRPVLEASPIDFDPFGMASQIVAESQDLTEIGVPGGEALDEANRIARQFLGV